MLYTSRENLGMAPRTEIKCVEFSYKLSGTETGKFHVIKLKSHVIKLK